MGWGFQRPPGDTPFGLKIHRLSRRRLIIALCATTLLGIIVTLVVVYTIALGPIDRNSHTFMRVTIPSGATAAQVGEILENHHLIRNRYVFEIYTQLTNTKSRLRAGNHALTRSLSLPQIVDSLVEGKTDDFKVTILPGLTLEQLADPSLPGSLADQGFTSAEIKRAFAASYTAPLLSGRPVGASLEGYLHPDTYGISAVDPLETVLTMSFTEMQRIITRDNIETRLKAEGLTLHQGIILASIVQREVSDTSVQPQVAQVFLRRLQQNMTLGSDVTFIYIAKKEGRTPSVNDPSPYNTRRVKGLPPGPIANFNSSALAAVANPASGDYLYFVAGDDGTTYFARTEAEHNANIAAHCHTLCNQ